MNQIIKENGLLRTITFLLTMAVPIVIIAAYIYTTVDWPYFVGLKTERTYFFVVLCWIFLGVRSKDIFAQGSATDLKPQHIAMFTVLLSTLLLRGTNTAELIVGFCGIAFISSGLGHKNMKSGLFWYYKTTIDDLSKEHILAAFKKEFFITTSTQDDSSHHVNGYGLFSLKGRLDINERSLSIRIEPMNSGFTFLLGLKVLPFNVGQVYGERILKRLEQKLEKRLPISDLHESR